jgi:hypothetical protein
MPDLFRSLDTPIFPWVWGASIAEFLAMVFIQVYYGRRLRTTAAPRGIVSLELASTEERTRAILDSWHHVPVAWADAASVLYWNFAFLLVYATILSHLCAWAGRTVEAAWNWPGAAGAGVVLAWLSWLAAACDAGENACLLRQLKAGQGAALAAMARTFALTKFVLIGIGLAFVAGGIVASHGGPGDWPSRGTQPLAPVSVTRSVSQAVPIKMIVMSYTLNSGSALAARDQKAGRGFDVTECHTHSKCFLGSSAKLLKVLLGSRREVATGKAKRSSINPGKG